MDSAADYAARAEDALSSAGQADNPAEAMTYLAEAQVLATLAHAAAVLDAAASSQ